MASSRLIPSKDTKGRRQPARKHERRNVPSESQKKAAREVFKHMAAANAESEVNEVARLRARIQELETEVRQLKRKNLALQSEVDELRAPRSPGRPQANPDRLVHRRRRERNST